MLRLREKSSYLVGPFLLALSLLTCGRGTSSGQAPSTNYPWAYRLLADSFLIDDCLICGRPSIQVPIRGSFNLRLVESNPISTRYALENIQFNGGAGPYQVTGSGTLEIGGEVVVTLRVNLQVQIDDGFTNKLSYFTNTSAINNRRWPMLDITLGQTNGTPVQTYTLRLTAAPIRDIWISTVGGFTGTNPPMSVQGGDLISTSGHIVKRNADLYTAVGAFPPAPDLGLDAVDMMPGGEMVFSLGSDITSTTLGLLHHGDLLSTKGRVVMRNQELLAAFDAGAATNDAGLDAVQVFESGEILFSILTNVFSNRLKVTLHPGDLLSSTGAIVRSNQQLLSRFHPADATNDYGLDALYVWPSGEVWFSTEMGFQDQIFGPVLSGDLLSDQGYIVFRNLELLNAFAPLEDPSDFGLDALYVVTDATLPAPPPLLALKTRGSPASVSLTWEGQGQVFQVERADTPSGPFQPLSDILPDLTFEDFSTLTNHTESFYRLRQW